MPESPVVIPETITVHLGAPSSNAQNVTVPFADYIKNVASSEIYPTWPEEAIRANIYAQISYVLNRVFTEWYRAQGYDFDITNSTRYDQSFVPGRDIFENISNIVDDMFNDYLTRGQAIEPLFAQYCNGTTSTCPGGLSPPPAPASWRACSSPSTWTRAGACPWSGWTSAIKRRTGRLRPTAERNLKPC